MRGKTSMRRGFTLVELIVVITIVGILAGILVPSIMGYIKKANKKADVASASMIGKALIAYKTLNFETMDKLEAAMSSSVSRYGGNQINNVKYTVTVNNSNGATEEYVIVSLIKLNGNKLAGPGQGQEHYSGLAWSAGVGMPQVLTEFAQDFTRECKENIAGGSDGFIVPMRVSSHDDPNKSRTDRWIIAIRLEEARNKQESMFYGGGKQGIWYNGKWWKHGGYEVWACDSTGIYGQKPNYRLWPSPDEEYLSN